MFWNKKDQLTLTAEPKRNGHNGHSESNGQSEHRDPPKGQSFLSRSVAILTDVVEARLNHHFGKIDAFVQPTFAIVDDGSLFARYVIEQKLTVEEYITLLLALSPHMHADIFTALIRKHLPKGGEFAEFGGVKGVNYRGIIPTGETALFILAGLNIDARMRYAGWLKGDALDAPGQGATRKTIFQNGVVTLEEMKGGEPEMSGRLLVSPEKITEFLTEKKWKPTFGSNFPATLLETKMEWDDVVLSPQTERELQMIKHWLAYHPVLTADRNLGKRTKPGYRALFYGPPGTGKTLTASLLGKEYGLDVYRIDLSLVVSKYIGETEKNLQLVFDKAQDWILFFDEADALFGKRTNVQSAHDRFANQEVSFLLQKIEEHPGLVILATNFRNNMDQAFIRRFQTVVPFNLPTEQESTLLWNHTMPADIPYDTTISLPALARKYELTGASILNIVQAASIRALSEDRPISEGDLLEAIRNEYYKNGKSV
ncbi:ATP-binding protein [Chryseolinea soli]|uniref:ATP-binding protein n=1 Tax=Chryseolinea soli TaxID=2321403 RepID=A0A385SSZ3_9BACT|nr:ATP-binding protein [Chryseolinea soli]AYB34002.1 ATP-binding protein [Chryseolinea soli]